MESTGHSENERCCDFGGLIPRYYTVGEVSEIIRYCISRTYSLIDDGRLHAIRRRGLRTMIKCCEVARFMSPPRD